MVLQKSFCSPITNSPGCRCGDRILMWGTTSFCDELTDAFGGAFEATSIDGCRLFCRLAEIWSRGVLGLLQHYLPKLDSCTAKKRSLFDHCVGTAEQWPDAAGHGRSTSAQSASRA